MTNDLARRISEHKSKLINGFSTRYNLYKLVYYEYTDSVDGAILREKQLKKWKREWKIRLIEEHNKNWDDLYDDLFQ